MSNTKILIGGILFTVFFAGFLFWPGNESQTTEQISDTDGLTEVVMYKNEGCMCCTKWAVHMEAAKFSVEEKSTRELQQIKQDNGITRELASCHTAFVDGYIVEGHVPVEDVQRLLAERPDAIGLAVPGMPIGSPGMEVPGRTPDNYDVLLVKKDGTTEVFASH